MGGDEWLEKVPSVPSFPQFSVFRPSPVPQFRTVVSSFDAYRDKGFLCRRLLGLCHLPAGLTACLEETDPSQEWL